MRKTKLVEILGENVQLSERDAYDVMVLSSTHIQGNANTKAALEMAHVVCSALKYCVRELKWYQIRKHIVYRWKFRLNYLLKHLAINSELPNLAIEVYRLEGIDVDKLLEDQKELLLSGEKKKNLNE
jgi:hypothetical protein